MARYRRARKWTLATVCLAMALAMASTQCTRVQVRNTLERPSANLVWPSGGDPARVRFIDNFRSPDDLFVRKRWMGLVDFFAGGKDLSFGIPYDIHLTPDNLLLVTDTGKGCVHFIDLNGHRYREVRKLGESALEQPIGVTADEQGRVYVSDSVLRNVFVFDREGNYLRPLTGPNTLQRPADIAYSPTKGILYVADVTAHVVRLFKTDGTVAGQTGGRGTGPGHLNFPTHLWVDRDGTLLVASGIDTAVNLFDASGEPLFAFGEQGDTPGYFSRPKGVATDGRGRVIVVDAIFDNFQIFDRRGSLLLAVGQSGTGPGELYLPAGVFIDSKDRIFVADQQNRRVAVFQLLEAGVQ